MILNPFNMSYQVGRTSVCWLLVPRSTGNKLESMCEKNFFIFFYFFSSSFIFLFFFFLYFHWFNKSGKKKKKKKKKKIKKNRICKFIKWKKWKIKESKYSLMYFLRDSDIRTFHLSGHPWIPRCPNNWLSTIFNFENTTLSIPPILYSLKGQLNKCYLNAQCSVC